ncbi:hypothetical protein PHPALM_30423 [Phytophthora palmivora]|uniref:Uncharacterized protein n=1 Tax=Phytophthora palmivora TaxID=4796 RepID=A0A2P4X572_9STRA|nr:hypothetical protein PHPALM_30423 [Phytophthora palmivora]
MFSCITEDVSVSDPVISLCEEVSMVFLVTLNIYNIVYSMLLRTKLLSYSQSGNQENMVLTNKTNIDYTGANSSTQGYFV